MKNILLTGASGFVGKRYLLISENKDRIASISVNHSTSFTPAVFEGVDTIVHMGGLAHQMHKTAPERYFEANYETTKRLADFSKKQGVKQFVFVSTIKVFGEHYKNVLTEYTECRPANDPYGQSKLKAEQYLQTIQDKAFAVSIVRSPLIYGPGVKGNLKRLLELCDSDRPLPFKNIDNRRTMIYLGNFIALIDRIIERRQGGIFLAGDNRPISTEELVRNIRKYENRSAKLFTIPYIIRRFMGVLKPDLSKRLFNSLEMDILESYERLQFYPPYLIEDGIKEMVYSYLQSLKEKNN